ncbi:MAG TPA: DUF4365 domain-containing protein [Pirellulales bacterium]|nr:DUF4365 domain-containing protein [Pirellulales bacterium]
MAALLDFCGNPDPYFDPHQLDAKFPVYDYLVELVGDWKSPPYFFVQVKSTKKSPLPGTLDLDVTLKKKDVLSMVHCPIPTYLIGVDEPNAKAYLAAVHAPRDKTVSQIPIRFPLNAANLRLLRDEVEAYWATLNASKKVSRFSV